jgi:acylphosphatase
MNNVIMGRSSARSAKRFVVRGRVQGVGYRQFALHRALQTGVTGYVKNLSDGSVEVHACGTPSQLDAFAGYLNQGPRFGEVRGVEVREAPLLQSDGFVIRYS